MITLAAFTGGMLALNIGAAFSPLLALIGCVALLGAAVTLSRA